MQRVHFQNLINCLFSRALFHETLDAYDSLEDVLALRKMLFLFNLELPTRTIVDHSHLVIAKHVVEDMKYFDRHHNNMQTLNEILFDPRTKNGFLKKNMVEKITGSIDIQWSQRSLWQVRKRWVNWNSLKTAIECIAILANSNSDGTNFSSNCWSFRQKIEPSHRYL